MGGGGGGERMACGARQKIKVPHLLSLKLAELCVVGIALYFFFLGERTFVWVVKPRGLPL